MINKMPHANLSVDDKKEILKFLGSPHFFNDIKEQNLSYKIRDQLFMYHLLAIGFNSTNIREGSISLNYYKIWNSENSLRKDINYQPCFESWFITSRNQPITNSFSTTTNSGIEIQSLYEDYKYRTPREFMRFMEGYKKNIPVLNDEESTDYEKSSSNTLIIQFQILNNKTRIEEGFKQIILDHPVICHFLSYSNLEKNILNNSCHELEKTKNRIKL